MSEITTNITDQTETVTVETDQASTVTATVPVGIDLDVTIIPAHLQSEHTAYQVYYPAHEPRARDPHYKLFNKARKRIIAAGIGCWICGRKDHLEIHHSAVEYSAAQGVDYEQLSRDHPEYHIENEEDFLAWVEGPSNFMVLCLDHHRSPFLGVHWVPMPNWQLQKYWKKDLPPVVGPPAKKDSHE